MGVALEVVGLKKSYFNQPILNNLSLTLEEGSIYGLVGSSGCGKTTLLSCILGLKAWDSGEILVFKEKMRPLSNAASTFSYMPQDIALYSHLTIREQLLYFGIIQAMPSQVLEESFQKFTKLLQLPKCDKFIKNLSGGEQRRVSLACALLNNPKILILDEPTVGVDPLLRMKIWDYLRSLSGVSIIITTHYLQETTRCDKIGVMRNGCLIVEENPNKLLETYEAKSLEEVVLQLCHRENNSKDQFRTENSKLTASDIELSSTSRKKDNTETTMQTNNLRYLGKQLSIFRSLVKLNITLITRNPVALMFQILLPLMQITMFATIIGKDPIGKSLIVVNNELNGFGNLKSCNTYKNYFGKNELYSCLLLQKFDPHVFNFVQEGHNYVEAVNLVKEGTALGVLMFPVNYTQHLNDRGALGKFSGNQTLEESTVRLFMDMTDSITNTFVLRIMTETYLKFVADILNTIGAESKSLEIPLKINSIHGNDEGTWSDFMIPGVILFSLIILNIISGASHLLDKLAGTFERSKTAGVKMWHILPAYLMSGSLIIFLQIALILPLAIFTFGMKTRGSLLLILIIVYGVGLIGLLTGFLLAMSCSHIMPFMTSCILVNSILMLNSGMIWPIQGAPKLLQILCKFVPTTMTSEALRSVSLFGSGLESTKVVFGLFVIFGWIFLILGLIALISMRRNKIP